MTPPDFTTWVPAPWGCLQVVTTPLGLRGLALAPGEVSVPAGAPQPSAIPWGEDIQARLRRYFAGEAVDFLALPLDLPPEATALQRQVWGALREIPYGQTVSYAWVAQRVERPQAYRAVGRIIGQNPVGLIIPCHRVIAQNGRLGGFMLGRTGGTALKAQLLALEGVTPR